MPIISGYCTVVKEPTTSKNLFGPISAIAGKTLKCIERNFRGDCLCISIDGAHLVDIDACDVEKFSRRREGVNHV